MTGKGKLAKKKKEDRMMCYRVSGREIERKSEKEINKNGSNSGCFGKGKTE